MKELSFEEAAAKLEMNAKKLQDEKISFEEGIRCYEEGIKYYKICTKILDESKQSIETIDECI